ncbi:TetR/AcrR family transcriptional regulator [Kineosporia mesophila]|uniref:TetR/AcrR family transcriptional regulator n=1 Tax=Kineosporia mesophila TaxID=566012 RepID=UPI001E2DDAB1|nr:TetR/AcrR family transcriptional regulator [Kineosporia mesophila]
MTGKTLRADARRNQETLLDAAAAVFVSQGVEAPIRAIATEAGVGTATIYRHFPTRADLIVAVYRHQVEALAARGPELTGPDVTPHQALGRWLHEFVDFVITKHGLPAVLQSADPCYDPLHEYFVGRLEPVCAELLRAAEDSGEINPGQDPYELMRAVGSLCAGSGTTRTYDARHLVGLLVAGLGK